MSASAPLAPERSSEDIYPDILAVLPGWTNEVRRIQSRIESQNIQRKPDASLPPSARRPEILYDGESQRTLACLDDDIRRVRVALHQARGLQRTRLIEEGVLPPGTSSTRPHLCPITKTTLTFARTSRRVVATDSSDHPTLKHMASINKALETAQARIESAATRLLREGQCRKELSYVQRALQECARLCQSRIDARQEELLAQEGEQSLVSLGGTAGDTTLNSRAMSNVRSVQDSFSLNRSQEANAFASHHHQPKPAQTQVERSALEPTSFFSS